MVAIYPDIGPFMNDYFASVKEQTYRKFDILILNDGLEKEKLPHLSNSIVIDMPTVLSPTQIRFEGIKYAIKNDYDNLIFSDADDFFSSNRIQESLYYLENNDFVYNNIVPVDVKGEPLGVDIITNYQLPNKITSYKKLLNYNLFGMSNTGLALSFLKRFNIPKDLIAVDWWIFTFLLLNGARGVHVKDAVTFYRQSSQNLVGMKKPLNVGRLRTGIEVKLKHYNRVYGYCQTKGLKKPLKDYSTKIKEMLDLESMLEDREFRKKYIKKINANLKQVYKGWWSEILPLNEWSRYE